MSLGSCCAFLTHAERASAVARHSGQVATLEQPVACMHAKVASRSRLHAASMQGTTHSQSHSSHRGLNCSRSPRHAASLPQAHLAALISEEQGGRPVGMSAASRSMQTVLRFVERQSRSWASHGERVAVLSRVHVAVHASEHRITSNSSLTRPHAVQHTAQGSVHHA
jgi:hypothetical protein